MREPAKEDDYLGTRIARRALKQTRMRCAVTRPLMLLAGPLLLMAAPFAVGKSPAAAGLLLAAGVGCLAAAFGSVEELVRPEPIPDGVEGLEFAVDAIRTSRSKHERDHVFVATTEDGNPVLLERGYYPMQQVCVGPTGYTKTHGGAMHQVTQLMEKGDVSVVYTGFKEDPAAVARLAEKAEECGMEVRIFTLTKGRASRIYNPRRNLERVFRNPAAAAATFATAAGLQKGEGHGKGHWAAQNELLVQQLFTNLPLPSFRHYVQALRERDRKEAARIRRRAGVGARQLELGSHAVAIMERLAAWPILNCVPGDPIPQSLFEYEMRAEATARRPTLEIWVMPALLHQSTAVVLARLYLYEMIATLHGWTGPRVKDMVMVYDDCAPLVEQNLKTIFANSRQLGLCLMPITQNISDFKNDDIDMVSGVLNNTAVKLWLGVKDREGAEYLIRASGEATRKLRSRGSTSGTGPGGFREGESEGEREVITPRITTEDILRVNADPYLAILEAAPHRGFTKLTGPTIVKLLPSITESEYRRYESTPWPEPDGIRTIRSDDIPPPPARPQPEPEPDAPTPPGPSRKEKRRGKSRSTPEERQQVEDLRARNKKLREKTP